MLIVLAGRLRRGERCRRRRDVQGASFGGSFVPCELRHPRQGCLSCEYRVDVVWSPFILSIDFFYVVYCSPYYFSLYNPRTPHLYFLCLLLSIYSITYTTFSIAPFYALVLLSLVFKKKKKKLTILQSACPVYQSSQWLPACERSRTLCSSSPPTLTSRSTIESTHTSIFWWLTFWRWMDGDW